ncbi:MAG: gliding motility-associated C-terminal domain-containing protein [Lewinellaceae bacterium]|nr:gliding motility-associated C-terminal domain-containing protein [Lewinellaceae bacterium]
MKQLMTALWSVVAFLTLPTLHAQNCNTFTLDAGPDAAICEPGASVNLNPTFNGPVLSASWSPSQGLGTPNSLSTTASPTATTTYTVQVSSTSSQNLIFNGNFSLGDVGFSTDYSYGNGGPNGILHNEGRYAIASNANDTHQNFASCTDHTGNGNMMVVNSSANPANVWCQTITVSPNTNYFFSAWITSVFPTNPARLQFSFNGVLLGSEFQASSTTCLWEQFAEMWNSGSNTSVDICIANVNNIASGNDFAIDDISFGQVCEYVDSVTVVVAEPALPPVVDCSSTTSTISLSWPPVAGATGYQVNVVNGPPATMLSDTSYLIEGLAPDQAVDIEITALVDNPCGNPTTTLTCNTAPCPQIAVNLDGPSALCFGEEALISVNISGASAGPFNVTLSNGPLPITIDSIEAGEYTFSFLPTQSFTLNLLSLVDVSASNCVFNITPTPTLSVEVNTPPEAGEGGQGLLCAGTDSLFQLANLLEGADAGGQWTDISASSSGSAFNASAATLSAGNLPAGQYQFEYNIPGPAGCPNSSAVVAIDIRPEPTANAGADEVLDCGTSEVSLGGPGTTSGASIVYSWKVVEGDGLSATDIPNPVTQSPGIFAFTVLDQATGCFSRDTVVVVESVTFPEPQVSVMPGACFGQNQGSVSIDSVSGGQEPFLYSIDGANFSPNAQFTGLASGDYTILVIDANNCEGAVEVMLAEPEELTVDLQAKSNGGSTRINLGDSLLLDAIINLPAGQIDNIRWNPALPNCDSCQQAYVSPQRTQAYTVTVSDINGCSASANLTVFVEQVFRYFIPNAFSPNEDGRNDIFFPNAGPEFLQVRTLHIMDRWGNLVFSRDEFPPNDPAYGWDGSFNGKRVAAGVYAFAIQLELKNGEVVTLGGDVAVMY